MEPFWVDLAVAVGVGLAVALFVTGCILRDRALLLASLVVALGCLALGWLRLTVVPLGPPHPAPIILASAPPPVSQRALMINLVLSLGASLGVGMVLLAAVVALLRRSRRLLLATIAVALLLALTRFGAPAIANPFAFSIGDAVPTPTAARSVTQPSRVLREGERPVLRGTPAGATGRD